VPEEEHVRDEHEVAGEGHHDRDDHGVAGESHHDRSHVHGEYDRHEHDHDHTLITDRLPEGVWRVDPGSSEVNFKARTIFGLVPVNGYFEAFEGELTVDGRGHATGSLVVDTTTIVTGIARRDQHLRSADVFDVQQYPRMPFTLEAVQSSGQDHLNLTGSLKIRETLIPLTFAAYAIQHGDHLHIEARVRIDHHAAGLSWGRFGMVARTARADVALTLNPVG